MKKLTLLLLIFVSVITACSTGEPVENKVESRATLELIAVTPEGVSVYIVKVTGNFETYLAVSKDGNSVSLAKH